MKRLALVLLLLFAPVLATAQTFQPLTSFTAPGTLAIVVGTPQFATATIHVEGSGAGMTFAAQGITSSGALVTLPMYAAASPSAAPVTSAAANGDWVVSVAGYTKFQWNLTAISSGTAKASIATSNQPAVVYAPVGGSGSNASVGTNGAAAPSSSTQIALPNAGGNLTAPVLNGNGGIPVVVSGASTSVPGAQMGLGVVTATALTVPATATTAQIVVEGQSVRCRDDGTAPTASVGTLYGVGTIIVEAKPALSALQCIQTAATATLDVGYYK